MHTLLFHKVWPETTDQRQIARLNLHRLYFTTINVIINSLGYLPTLPHPYKLTF